MKTEQNVIVRRSEYRPPEFMVDSVDLCFDLDPTQTEVKATLQMRRNTLGAMSDTPLVLDGEQLELLSVLVDGQQLSNAQYKAEDDKLTIEPGCLPPSNQTFTLTTTSRTNPQTNSSLTGLYESNGNLYTQCEAEGFRRITWFLDRPDIMSRFTVTLRGDKSAYPVMLSNGNLIEAGDIPGKAGWHQARWEDPFAKPSYLFALVAGNLVVSEREVKTASGKPRLLQIWV